MLLARFRISRVLDVGTAAEWTMSLMTAFLMQYNPGIRVITLDTRNIFKPYPDLKDLLPLEYYPGKTSKDFVHESFDLAFIDADQSYGCCLADDDAVGRQAALCAFHETFIRSCFEWPPYMQNNHLATD